MKTTQKEYKDIAFILGNALDKYILENKNNLDKISSISKIHSGNISRITSGKNSCSIAQLDQFLYALDLSLHDFFTPEISKSIRNKTKLYIDNKNEEELGYTPNSK